MAFILKYKKREQTTVVLQHQKGIDGVFRYSTGKSVETKYWNQANGRVDIPKSLPDPEKRKFREINSHLEKMEKFLEKSIDSASIHETKLSVEYLFNAFEKEYKLIPSSRASVSSGSEQANSDFLKILDLCVEQAEGMELLTRKKKKFSPNVIKNWRKLKSNLSSFQPEINVNGIDIKFYNNYINFRNKQGRALNTVGNEIKVFKMLLKMTYNLGWHSNTFFTNENFISVVENVEKEYLNDGELDKLWSLKNLPPHLELTRDVFLIGCYTGLRYADLAALDRHNISKEQNRINVIPQKTLNPVSIPIHWRVAELIKKYRGRFPKAHTDQRMNKYLKDLCEHARFTSEREYVSTVGGMTKRVVVKKFNKISTHTARRSFATNLYINGMDSIDIMGLTGHKTETEFMKYICVTRAERTNRLQANPYWHKQPILKKAA